MSNDSQQKYANTEMFSLANRSCLIGFNDLMKNYQLADTPEERKVLKKKNKIQISYVDLSKKVGGKHPKYDFFVDPEEIKYMFDLIYSYLKDINSNSYIKQYGHKIMGGHKKPQIISNIVTFKFLTNEELSKSPGNVKIFDKYNQDLQKYQNGAFMDWKNIQVGKFEFDKQIGRDMNGLIVPTGKRIEGANFKPYYISAKDLLELVVTVLDKIRIKEQIFAMQLLGKTSVQVSDNLSEDYYGETYNGNQVQEIESNSTQLGYTNNTNDYQNNNQNNNQSTPVNTPVATAEVVPTNHIDPSILNEAKNVLNNSKLMFTNVIKVDKINLFLESLHIANANFDKVNNLMNIELKYVMPTHTNDLGNLQEQKDSVTNYFNDCVNQILQQGNKNYKIKIYYS